MTPESTLKAARPVWVVQVGPRKQTATTTCRRSKAPRDAFAGVGTNVQVVIVEVTK